jgi:hypothetical protein
MYAVLMSEKRKKRRPRCMMSWHQSYNRICLVFASPQHARARKAVKVYYTAVKERESCSEEVARVPGRGAQPPSRRPQGLLQTADAYMGGNSLKLQAMPAPKPDEAAATALEPHCVSMLGSGRLAMDEATEAVVSGGLR